jgi:uncharacterized protein YeaO (DUF488 family)
MIRVKRTYEPPARTDGQRILVERLWPRGLRKEALAASWMKDVAPSAELRRWFGHDPERWRQFRTRYRAELDAHPGAWGPIADAAKRGTVTLLYSAHDVDHNSAIALRDYLIERDGAPTGRSARARPAAAERPAPRRRARRSR